MQSETRGPTPTKARWLSRAKYRAKRRGIEFTLETVEVPDVCPVLGIPLRFSAGRYTANTPSLDRIDPSRGYTPDNVRVISMRANEIKHNATPEELMRVACAEMERHRWRH